MLALCLGVQLLEVSGRWDRTIRDSNDEAGIVAIVLCIGVGLVVAPLLLARIRASRVPLTWTQIRPTRIISTAPSDIVPCSCDSPPLPLRI